MMISCVFGDDRCSHPSWCLRRARSCGRFPAPVTDGCAGVLSEATFFSCSCCFRSALPVAEKPWLDKPFACRFVVWCALWCRKVKKALLAILRDLSRRPTLFCRWETQVYPVEPSNMTDCLENKARRKLATHICKACSLARVPACRRTHSGQVLRRGIICVAVWAMFSSAKVSHRSIGCISFVMKHTYRTWWHIGIVIHNWNDAHVLVGAAGRVQGASVNVKAKTEVKLTSSGKDRLSVYLCISYLFQVFCSQP